MKKILTLTLCLLMMASVAMAGTQPLEVKELTDKLTLVYEIPEGVKSVEIDDVYDMKLISFELEDETMPNFVMVVSYSDLLDDRDITDMDDAEIAAIAELTVTDSDHHTYDRIEMNDGWPAVVIDILNDGEDDWVDAFTIISGYIIQLHGWHDDFSLITDAQMDMAFTLLDSIDIVDMTE